MPTDKGLRQRLKKKIRDKFHPDPEAVDSRSLVSSPTAASSALTSNAQGNALLEPSVDLEEHAFQVAVRKLQDGLKEEERKDFLDAISGRSKGEIVKDIVQLDQRHEKASKSRRDAGTIHKMIQILDPSIQAISLVLSADPAVSQISSLILGGFKLILKVRYFAKCKLNQCRLLKLINKDGQRLGRILFKADRLA